MRLAQATLIKRKTDDGTFEVFADVPVGRVYEADLDSIEVMHFIHVPTGKPHQKETILVRMDENDKWGPYPTEMLRITEPS